MPATTLPLLSPDTTETETPCRYRVNSIINADCLDVLAKMKPDMVDLTVFSPPYDNIRDYREGWSFDSASNEVC